MRKPYCIAFVLLLLAAVALLAGCENNSSIDTSTPAPAHTAHPATIIQSWASPTPRRTAPIHPTLSPTIPTPQPTFPPSPTPTSVVDPLSLPELARITEIKGKNQSLPLSCESRSAVDLAGFFGIVIDEIEFVDALPVSEDPETGFVGNVYGSWGQIPPSDYGVHPPPVAALLRKYGLNARAVSNLDWQVVRAEVAAGRPVMVWVIGHVEEGLAVYYIPPGGPPRTVAPFEHTVLVVGYTPNYVYILDGKHTYVRPQTVFLQSWDVLGHLAILVGDPAVIK
ncbi:MAG TPA: C39 family peptidase [Anaerolineaceae bacterium]|nr:C39 family peptidase [Anaerolineaceae bacterium]